MQRYHFWFSEKCRETIRSLRRLSSVYSVHIPVWVCTCRLDDGGTAEYTEARKADGQTEPVTQWPDARYLGTGVILDPRQTEMEARHDPQS